MGLSVRTNQRSTSLPPPAASGLTQENARIRAQLDAAVVPSGPVISSEEFGARLIKIQQDFRDLKAEMGDQSNLKGLFGFVNWQYANLITLRPKIEAWTESVQARQALIPRLNALLDRIQRLGRNFDRSQNDVHTVLSTEFKEIDIFIKQEQRINAQLKALRLGYINERARREKIQAKMLSIDLGPKPEALGPELQYSDPELAALEARMAKLRE